QEDADDGEPNGGDDHDHGREVPLAEDRQRQERLAGATHVLREQEKQKNGNGGAKDLGNGHERPDSAPVVALALDQPEDDAEDAGRGPQHTQEVEPGAYTRAPVGDKEER